MQVGDLVGHINGDGPTGIVLATWTDVQPGIGIEETWCEILWGCGEIWEYAEKDLERVQ